MEKKQAEKTAAKKKSAFKRKRRHTGRDIAISVLAVLAAACAAGAAYFFFDDVQSMRISKEIYLFRATTEVSYTPPSTILLADERGPVLQNGNTELVLGAAPIYYSETELLLPASMICPDYKRGQSTRIPAFSTVSVSGTSALIRYDGEVEEPTATFLYDGADTYLFLQATVIRYGGEEISLSALSYATVTYSRSIEYVDAATRASGFIQTRDTVTASFADGASVDLGTDVLTNPNGIRQILMTQPELLPELF